MLFRSHKAAFFPADPTRQMRCVAVFLALLQLAAALVVGPVGTAIAPLRAVSTVSMAHHVQKKATKKHNAMRPRKSRASDRNRTPPSYPSVPDIPWMVPIDAPTGGAKQIVSLAVEPSDTADSIRSKLAAAGAPSATAAASGSGR